MDKTIRIRTTPNSFKSSSIRVNIEQDFDFIQILSLNISQNEAYRRFCSDYGVVVGRVIMNGGVGVPNAKVSIFVKASEYDDLDDEIKELYPYETPLDKNDDGIIYNLLPKNQKFECHTPIGSFPDKREILDVDKYSDVYCKYYKYTSVTNEAGDFMIFGVPVGEHNIVFNVDISDIGIYSQRPYDLIREGSPKEIFEGTTQFKSSKELLTLPQFKSNITSVNVIPFWGDKSNCEIGITRIDFDTKIKIQPSALFIGSAITDSHKNSVNKRCRPRKKTGYICDMTTTPGSINILRKTVDGGVEEISIDGGRVINDDGVWAFQVPMNLDYMVTNEFGELVPSESPNKGIPTRAKVRFKVGLDMDGGDGRLRTRASYLVPHNPNTINDVDYNFNEETKEENFRDLYWNKIYTVKNFIPRFQATSGHNKRTFIGIKDVDDCVGTANPFPFNRIDSKLNPLFLILCIIIQIISFIIVFLNSVIFKIINSVFKVINDILKVICKVIWFIGKLACSIKSGSKKCNCKKKACIGDANCDCGGNNSCDCDCNKDYIDYIGCIIVKCNDETYGPGCEKSSDKISPYRNTDDKPQHYPDDGHPGHGANETSPKKDAGWAFCLSIQLAEILDVWKFDFYNDWVNGVLYFPLFKYKKNKKGKEKFCENNCSDYGDGVDGNNDNIGDNKCRNNYLVDTCTSDGADSNLSDLIRDGLINKHNDTLYYSPISHNDNYKLLATDLVILGSMYDCDWQNILKIHDRLNITSYKTPDLLDEYDGNKVIVSGYDSASNDIADSLFFNLTCTGIETNARTCENIKRICEIGVGLDEDRTDEPPKLGCNGSMGIDRVIDNCDVDDLLIRDYFALLNEPNSGIDLLNFTDSNKHALFNSVAYELYRGVKIGIINQPSNSFYFYFGLRPGKSALDLMKEKYFNDCKSQNKTNITVNADINHATSSTSCDGSISLEIIYSSGSYDISWEGPGGFTSTSQNISNLCEGTYVLKIITSDGKVFTYSYYINGGLPLYCFLTPVNISKHGLNDGKIIVTDISGGDGGPYTLELKDYNNGNIINTTTVSNSNSYTFTNLPAGNYEVNIYDVNNNSVKCSPALVTIIEPDELIIDVQKTDITCYGANDGEIYLDYTSGNPPITWSITGPNGFSSSNTNLYDLEGGTYTITATDSLNQTVTQTVNISEPQQISPTITFTDVTCYGNNDGTITISNITGGVPPYTIVFDFGQTETFNGSPVVFDNLEPGEYEITITDDNGCEIYATIPINEPGPISPGVTTSSGDITISPSGGQAPYVVKIYDSSNNQVYSKNIYSGGSDTYTPNSIGTYTVEVTDNNGCSETVSIIV
jgi:hypothetical protein